jgi:hypothetical protein
MSLLNLTQEDKRRHVMAERVAFHAKPLLVANPYVMTLMFRAHRNEEKVITLSLDIIPIKPDPIHLEAIGEHVVVPPNGMDELAWAMANGKAAAAKLLPVLNADQTLKDGVWAFGDDYEPGLRILVIDKKGVRKPPREVTEETHPLVRTYLLS